MDQGEFEGLVSALGWSRGRVEDAGVLLEVTCRLLGAESALLLTGAGDEPAIEAAWPEAMGDVGPALTSVLREDGLLRQRAVSGQGFTAVSVGAERWEILLAFGRSQSRESPVHRLALMRSEREARRWNSYHTWVAAFLLDEHDLLRSARSLARLSATTRRLERAVRREILRDEAWDSFVGRLDPTTRGDAPFMCEEAVLWTAYRVRDKGLGLGFPAGIENGEEDESSALQWIQNEAGNGRLALGGAESACLELLTWLVQSTRAFQDEYRVSANGTDVGARGEVGGAAYLELPAVLRQGVAPRDVADLRRRVLALEHAWCLVRSGALASEVPTAALLQYAGGLLDVTCNVVAEVLTLHDSRRPDRKHGASGSIGDVDATDRGVNLAALGRDELRQYFVLLLGRAQALRRRYLDEPRNGEPRVADQARRGFVRGLARYVLSVIVRIEDTLEIDCSPAVVTGGEVLDSLLLLVDRYAHVELGVDDALEIQRLLAQGMTAEVSHHILQGRYRDHLIHVLDVFLLGHVLLDTELRWFGGRKETLEAHLSRLIPPQGGTAHWHREWAVAALLHDLGYQAWSDADDRGAQIYTEFFSLRGGSWPEWLSPGPRIEEEGHAGARAVTDFVSNLLKELARPCGGTANHAGAREAVWWPTDAAETPRDHGILSALRVAQLLVHADSAGKPGRATIERTRLAGCEHALHAIAHHNRSNQTVSLASHPLACLLRVCDELQEWGRRRVNVEQMVKGLYLSIEGEGPARVPSFESLRRMYSTVRFHRETGEAGESDTVRAVVPGEMPTIGFRLEYRDPVEASFDPIFTLLSKAFNLQAVDLQHDRGETQGVRIEIELSFTLPKEYGNLTEHDLYGMFAETTHGLPALCESKSLGEAFPGLSHLRCGAQSEDRFAIIVEGGAGGRRVGWLPLCPGDVLSGFIGFKRGVLGREG